MAKGLIRSGVVTAEAWFKANRDPLHFVEFALSGWLDEHGGKEAALEFYLDVGLVSDLDPHGQGEDGEGTDLFLIVEPNSAGYVVLGPTLRSLERIHPCLPATFFHFFTDALNRWIRVYDYRDAAERVEQMREWFESDPSDEPIEVPDVEGAIPRCLRGKKRSLSQKTVERLLTTIKDRKLKALMECVLELRAASVSQSRPEVPATVREALMDSNPPVPAVLAVFEKHDAIEGCFDEEAQGMLECAPEPNLILPFQPADADSVAVAFRTLAVACKVWQLASRLIKLMTWDKE
ncbi:MAG: hypothetical protein K2X03_02275 [Bryobacteraceae bacterium]|nr:hypothetical protein [Bryobacteraceae bacterium]